MTADQIRSLQAALAAGRGRDRRLGARQAGQRDPGRAAAMVRRKRQDRQLRGLGGCYGRGCEARKAMAR